MANKDVLSQEELDALLNNVENDEAEGKKSGKGKSASKKSTLKGAKDEEGAAPSEEEAFDACEPEYEVINFASQERVVRGELPVLDKIHDRAVRFFLNDLYKLVAKEFEIKQEPLVIKKHKDYIKKLPSPTLMSTYRFSPLRGKALVHFDSAFVYDMVDYYFGGHSHFMAQTDKNDFTATELRVMEIIREQLLKNLRDSWSAIIKLDMTKVSDETNPTLVTICDPDELLLISRFVIDFGKEEGSFSLVMPFTMIEPLKQQLELGASSPDDEIDPNWVHSLVSEIMDVELEICSVMRQADSTLGKVMAWKEGDFLPLEKSEVVTLDIEGTPTFKAKLGTANEKRALQIISTITY